MNGSEAAATAQNCYLSWAEAGRKHKWSQQSINCLLLLSINKSRVDAGQLNKAEHSTKKQHLSTTQYNKRKNSKQIKQTKNW